MVAKRYSGREAVSTERFVRDQISNSLAANQVAQGLAEIID